MGTHIESYDGADTLDASINLNGSQNLDGNGSYTSSYRIESGNSDGIQAVASSLSSDPSSTSTGSDNYQAGTSSGSVQFGANSSGDGEASVSAIGESVNANGSSNWNGGGGANSTGTGSGSFARTTIANDDVITKIVGNYETRGNGESSGGGGGDGTFSLEDQARKANANFGIAGVTSGSLSSQTTGTISTHLPDGSSYTVPFRNNQFASGGSDASLDALASIDPLASITSRANGDVDAGENGFSFNTSFVGLKSDTIDSGFDLTISSVKTDNGEEYDFDSKEGDLTRNGTFNDESLERVFNLTFATGTDEKSSGSTHSTIKWSSLDNSFVEADRSLEGAFAEFGLSASSEGGSTPIIRTASGDIDDTVTTWSKSITTNTTETRRGFVEDEDGEWTIEKDPSTEDYDAAYAKYNSLVITNGDSEVHTTGTARLVNDDIVSANTTDEFNTHGDSRSIRIGHGYDTSQSTRDVGEADQSKLTSRTDWNNNSTITSNSDVEDGVTKTRYLLGVSGSKTDLTLTQNGTSRGGGTATTIADAYSDWANADGGTPAGYKTHTHSEVTVTSSGGGDSESTSEGWYATGSLAGVSRRLGSSFSVDSEINGNGETTTTWDVTTTGDKWSEESNGTQIDGSKSKREFDGTVLTGGGLTGTSGTLNLDNKNWTDLDSEAHSKDNRTDTERYTDAYADVDQSTRVETSGKLLSGGFAGQSGYEIFIPNGDPEITETGGYDFEVTTGREYDQIDHFEWQESVEWSSGGVDKPQKVGNSRHYVKELTIGSFELSIDNFTSTETVTTKEGERGLREVTTAEVDNFQEEIANPSESITDTTTDTTTEVGTTTTTFTSAGNEQGDKQELVIDHELTQTDTNRVDYDKSGDPEDYDFEYRRLVSGDLKLYTHTDTTTKIDKNYYKSTHNLGQTGNYQAKDESSKEVRETGDGDWTYEWEGTYNNGAGNVHGSTHYVSKMDVSTGSSTETTENGTYDSLDPGGSQSGSYKTITTEYASADPSNNYLKKTVKEYDYLYDHDDNDHTHLTLINDYKETATKSIDKEIRTVKSGGFGKNAPDVSNDKDGTSGHDNYHYADKKEGTRTADGGSIGGALHGGFEGVEKDDDKQQLTHKRDGTQSGYQTQYYSINGRYFDFVPDEDDDFEPFDHSASGPWYRDDLGQDAPSDTPAEVNKQDQGGTGGYAYSPLYVVGGATLALGFTALTTGGLFDGYWGEASNHQGQHWVPNQVTKNATYLSGDAAKVFENGYSGALPYIHGNDTWNGVTHNPGYNQAVGEVLDSFSEKLPDGKVNEQQAEAFLTYIKEGKITGDKTTRDALTTAIAQKGDAVSKINRWKNGFIESIVIGKAAREVDGSLDSRDIKKIAQQKVNGSSAEFVNPARAKKALQKINNLPKDVLSNTRKLIARHGFKAVKVLGPLGVILSAQNGYAGTRNGNSGVVGAAEQAISDMMMAEDLENYVFKPIGDRIKKSMDRMQDDALQKRLDRFGVDEGGNPVD